MEISVDLSAHRYAIAIPCYEGKIQVETCTSLLSTTYKFNQHQIGHAFLIIRGGALIADVRNELCHRFLHETDADTLICIDADIEWDWEALERLLVFSTLYPVVAGIYPARVEPTKFIVNHRERKLNEHGLLPIEGCGMGFVAIQRKCLEGMKTNEYDHRDYDKPVKQFFATTIEDRKPIGEDVFFFRRATEQGFECMADPGINLKHHGTKVYDAKLGDYIHQILEKED